MPSSRRLRLAALSSFLLACSLPACSSDPEAPPPQENASDPLAEALERDTGVVWVVYRDDAGRAITAAPLATPRALLPGATAEAVARDFFDRYGSLLGVKDAKAEIEIAGVHEGADGITHVTFSQKSGGLTVWDSGSVVHVDKDGALAWVEPTFVANAAGGSATIAKSDAIDRAKAATGRDEILHEPELGVLSGSLAWAIGVTNAEGASLTVHVDAKNGSILEVRDPMQHIVATALTAKSYLVNPEPERRSFFVQPFLGGWLMEQPSVKGISVGVDVRTFVAQVGFNTAGDTVVGDLLSDRWDATGRQGAGSAVDAYTNMIAVTSWWQKTMKREAFDGKGTTVRVFVHGKIDGGGAYAPADDAIIFDDKTTEKLTKQEEAENVGSIPPASALDSVAHEFTHAVTASFAAQPAFKWRGLAPTTKPLNEALADIFAATVEHDLRPGPGNLLLGDDAAPRGRPAIRDHVNPDNASLLHPQIAIYDAAKMVSLDPHLSAGVATKAWSLMTLGGSFREIGVPGALGWNDARDLFWDTLRSLREDPAPWQMPALARNQIANARARKWSSQKIDVVACSWRAVNALSATEVTQWLGRAPKCDAPIADSCAGKPTRQFYCSELVPFSAYYCDELGGIALGAQCLGRCRKKTWEPLAPADVINGQLQCDAF